MGSICIFSTAVGRGGPIPSATVVSSDYRRTVYDSLPQDRLIFEQFRAQHGPVSWQGVAGRHARRQILDTSVGSS
jgi:hypothetical protein